MSGGYRKNYSWRNVSPPEYYNGNGMRHATYLANLASATSQTFSNNNKYAFPVVLPAGSTYDTVAIYGTSTGSGNARLGLYANDDKTNRPGALMYDWGTVSQAASERTLAITCEIQKTDVYWLVMQIEDANFLARWFRSFGLMPLVTTAYEAISSCLQATTTAGSLANPWGTSIAVVDKAPQIFLKCDKVAAEHVSTKNIGATALDGIVGQLYNNCGTDYTLGSVASDMALTAETIYHMPFYLSRGCVIGQMGASISATAASGKGGWYCIYSSDSNGRPDKLMWVSSKQDFSAGTPIYSVDVTVDRYFPAGHYYMGVKCESGSTPTFDGISSAGGYLSAVSTANWPAGTFSVADVTGNPPPATFPTGTVSETRQSVILQALSYPSGTIGSQERDLHYSHTQNRTVIPYHHFRKGWWTGPHGMEYSFPASPNKTAISNSNTNLCPLFVHRTTLFDEISFDLTTDGTSGDIKLGLYSSQEHASPYKLMRTFGTYTVGAGGGTGIKTISISPPLKLEPGLYYKAIGGVNIIGNPDIHSHEVLDVGKACNEGASNASHTTLGSSFPSEVSFSTSFSAQGAALHMKIAGFG